MQNIKLSKLWDSLHLARVTGIDITRRAIEGVTNPMDIMPNFQAKTTVRLP
ncbi:hypothetical protein QUA31_01315 [Microcoleus sp. Pol14D5]|uniref:hypothetical protein n=1 Tax=unclassified Microcoleus TaxID=2642155 RepID=UPI002FD2F31E